MRRAVIDIGTNTVKLLVADIRDGQVCPVVSKDITTRLGEGVDSTRQLNPSAIVRTVAAITGGARLAHVTHGEAAKWGVLGEDLHAHGLLGDHLDDGGIAGDETGAHPGHV